MLSHVLVFKSSVKSMVGHVMTVQCLDDDISPVTVTTCPMTETKTCIIVELTWEAAISSIRVSITYY